MLLTVLLAGIVSAQTIEVKGRVTDSLRAGLSGVTVQLYKDRDTLRTHTESEGYFYFRTVPNRDFSITVRSLGYGRYQQQYRYSAKEQVYELPPIVLYPEVRTLAEVQVRAPQAMQVRKDTVEYNAGSYALREHDRLQDLLRQLPGIAVGADGQVTAMGHSMTKLRVNGKDFFTNNLADFLNQLPAGIIDKLQVIDDYGDQANFTGIKIGRPQKMLNLVIKEGQSKGVFGGIAATANTQELYGVDLKGNLWRDVHQLGGNAGHNQSRTDEGRQSRSSAGVNYRWQDNKLNLFGTYAYGKDRRSGATENYVESVTGQGVLYSRIQTSNADNSDAHQFQVTVQQQTAKDFVNLQVRAQLGERAGDRRNFSKQSGIILQDLDNRVENVYSSKGGNLSLSWSRNMQKQGRTWTAQFSIDRQNTKDDSDILDQLHYYNPVSAIPFKDSMNIRQVLGRQRSTQVQLSTSFSEPLHGGADDNSKGSLDLQYRFAMQYMGHDQDTHAPEAVRWLRVDSLSNGFTSRFDTHQLDLSYRQVASKLQYSVGGSILQTHMRGHYTDSTSHLRYQRINFLPILSLQYQPSVQNSLLLSYSGQAIAPSIAQLMPLRDVHNLQQVVVGNPALKPAVQHGLSLDLNRLTPAKGRIYHLSFHLSTVQDQVVSNLLLLPDTLQILRQEMHYRNASGSCSFSAAYDMTLPFAKYYQVRWASRGGWSRSLSYVDDVEGTNHSSSLSQSIGLAVNSKKLSGTVAVYYARNANAYQLDSITRMTISSWDMSADINYTLSSRLRFGLSGSYRINQGYTVPINNPFLINVYGEWFVSARKDLSIELQAYDLLDQQQSVYQSVTANSISQRTMNRIGRYVTLGIKYDLSRFGGG